MPGGFGKKRLLTVKNDAGGHTAQARLVPQEGDVVWLYLNDGPVAVSSKDGSALADRSTLEQCNPALRDLVPKELEYYAYDGGLVLTAADARRFRVRGPEFTAEPYGPPNDEDFQQVQFMATRWNSGYKTRDFLVRQMMLNGRWVGFLTKRKPPMPATISSATRLRPGRIRTGFISIHDRPAGLSGARASGKRRNFPRERTIGCSMSRGCLARRNISRPGS